jgi:PKD repeat protein/Flp pilus assembly protein TadG
MTDPSAQGIPMLLRRFARLATQVPTRSRRRRRSRGQSLVEFALVIPIILMLTLIALDFGRVYLGAINLQNMARIAANFAANTPTPDYSKVNNVAAVNSSADLQKYRNGIINDATATNCRLPKVGNFTQVPVPVFADMNGNGQKDLGDEVKVQITCTFQVITPLISNILGGTLPVSAESNFPVKAGMSVVVNVAGGGAVAPTAAFLANGVVASWGDSPVKAISGVMPFDVEFRDTSGGNPDTWLWKFDDGTADSTLQDPLVHTFTCAFSSCVYNVSMKASNITGSSTAWIQVTVLGTSDVNFTSNTQSGTPPLTVNFSDNGSTAGGSNYRWTFGDGGTGTGTAASHTYASVGTYTVTLTVNYPTGDITETKVGYISVQAATCTVPSLYHVKFSDAQAVWNAAGFTGLVTKAVGAPSNDFQINAQDKTAGSTASCSSGVVVDKVNGQS